MATARNGAPGAPMIAMHTSPTIDMAHAQRDEMAERFVAMLRAFEAATGLQVDRIDVQRDTRDLIDAAVVDVRLARPRPRLRAPSPLRPGGGRAALGARLRGCASGRCHAVPAAARWRWHLASGARVVPAASGAPFARRACMAAHAARCTTAQLLGAPDQGAVMHLPYESTISGETRHSRYA